MSRRVGPAVDRRDALAALCAMCALGWNADAGARTESRVEWTDVPLIDGRMLTARELRSQPVVVEDVGHLVPVLHETESACAEAA